MSLKTSFFNKSLFKSDIKRFWWIGVLETLILFMVFAMPLFQEYNDWYYSLYWDGAIAAIGAVSIGIVALLFSYMHFSASVSSIHSFPLKKKCLYITKLVSGAFLTIAPVLINAVLIFVIQKFGPADKAIVASDVIKWALVGVMYIFVIFSLATLTNSMTGNPVGTIVFTIGFLVLPQILVEAFEGICNYELYGYWDSLAWNILNYIYVGEHDLLEPANFIFYLAAGTLMLFGGYFLYKFRKLENYSEVIAYSWLKPVFIGIISFLTSFLGYMYLGGIFENYNLLYVLPFGILGTVIAWMIAKKSIKIKGILKPVLVYVILAGIVISAIEFDVTGYETRVPDEKDVKEIKMSDNAGWYYRTDVSLTSEENIKNVIELHKYCIEERNENGNTHIWIEYLLNNGKTLKREYQFSLKGGYESLKTVWESDEYKKSKFPILGDEKREYTQMHIGNSNTTIYPSEESFKKLYDAIRLDVAEVTFEQMIKDKEVDIIELSYKEEAKEHSSGSNMAFVESYNRFENYVIRENYVNTISVLKEMGIYK